MPSHGLLSDHAPPSREVLCQWLDAHDIGRSDALDIVDMTDGSGWGVWANRSMELGEVSMYLRDLFQPSMHADVHAS